MAQFLDGDSTTFDQLLYGNSKPYTQEFIENERAQFQQHMTPTTAAFFQKSMEVTAAVLDSRAVQLAKSAVRKVQNIWESDEIRALTKIGDFQHAPAKMKRFIMAEPETRKMWKRQLCDGFNDMFIDNIDETGEDLLEYRQAMDGIMSVDTGGYDWECTTYDNDNLDQSLEITVDDQFDILDTWDNLKILMAEGKEDPTSELNASLG